MFTVTFKQSGSGDVKVSAALGENLLSLADKAGIRIDAPCAGNGTCGKCRLRLISGAVDQVPNQHLSKEDKADGWILACQSSVCGDCTLLVPDSARAFVSGIQTADLGTAQERHMYEQAIGEIFAPDTGLHTGCPEKGAGIAIDIGTTTVTGALLDLETGELRSKASAGNQQIRYGADVINRIIRQSQPGGVERLRHAVREDTVNRLIAIMCKGAGLKAPDLKRFSIVGNTTMEHLFVGEDAESIRLEPYVPKFLELHGKTAGELGIPGDKNARVIFAPNVGSYVGGDISAGVLSSMIWNSEALSLFVDLGTNGELVLGNSDWLLCCACSAGPAFEGGDISCGMRATQGAIQAVDLDPDTMEPTYDIIVTDPEAERKYAGLCGSGLISLVGELFRCGVINSRGKFVREGRRVVRNEYGGAYVVAFPEESASGSRLTLDETDIDNFIRAKAAIFSAIRAMLNSVELTVDDLERVIIAGGIGSGINIEEAISVGMLPKIPVDKYSYIGNSALTGACAMLLSDEAEEKVYELGRNMTYLELSTHPGYMDEFVAACFLPHTDATLFD